MFNGKLLPLCRSASRWAPRVPCRWFNQRELRIKSDFFENHPIDQKTIDELESVDAMRKSQGNIELVKRLFGEFTNETNDAKRDQLQSQLRNEFKKFPNQTHPTVLGYGVDATNVEVDSFGDAFNQPLDKNTRDYVTLANLLNMIRLGQLGNFTGTRSYYLTHHLAELEQALIQYTTDHLKQKDFQLISVPDILPADVIEGCGMQTHAKSTQVYRLRHFNTDAEDEVDRCLSGTSEMALGGYFSGKTFAADQLPQKVMAVSRCYRAEAGDGTLDRNLYRVHYFTKVEMFSVCHPRESEKTLESFRATEVELFRNLGLSFKVFDMPIHELGATAYRKYDIEAWMPSRNGFGEISSTSNCTDYQAKRLNIYIDENGNRIHAHTVNGTACAIPRMIIAILEQFQTAKSIRIPEALQPYMNREELVISRAVPQLKFVKKIKTEADKEKKKKAKKN